MCGYVQQATLQTVSVSLAALNGSRVSPAEGVGDIPLHLYPSDFAVISFKVRCPSDIRHEIDFLTRAVQCRILLWASAPSTRALMIHANKGDGCAVVVDAAFMDELSMWEYYTELPGGVVLLDPRRSTSNWNYEF